MAYSLDFRRKVVAAYDGGESAAAVARRFDVNERTVRNYVTRRDAGKWEADKPGPTGSTKLTHEDDQTIKREVEQEPGVTQQERVERLGGKVVASTVSRAIKRLGLSRKKKTLKASEQDRPEVRARRQSFVQRRERVEAERFVFLDESGVSTHMTRLYGWSPVGERCHDSAPAGHRQATTMLTAIGIEGPLASTVWVFEGALNGAMFVQWVRERLAPALKPGQIVVMDNLSSHKVAGVVEAIESVGAELWYLPPYSPDLNPIEKLWSKVKAYLRGVAARTWETLWQAVGDALRAVGVDECRHYFESCGYAT